MTGWGFLIDENSEREIARILREEGHRAEMVVDVLDPGAEDEPDVLTYAVENDLIVFTKDYTDFMAIDYDDHEGLVVVERSSRDYSAHEYALALLKLIEDYGDRDRMRHSRKLDAYL